MLAASEVRAVGCLMPTTCATQLTSPFAACSTPRALARLAASVCCRAVGRTTRLAILASSYLVFAKSPVKAQSGGRARTTIAASPTRRALTTSAPGSTPGVSRELAAYRLTHVHDVRYALSLDVTQRDTAVGEVDVSFVQLSAADIVLDFRGIGVSSLSVNGHALGGAPSSYWNGAHVRIPASYSMAGTNHVVVSFRAPIAPAGASIIRARDATDGADYLYTLLVPSDANLLFPCFDQPDLKARVTLTLTTPPSWRALGNGVATARDSTAATVVHHFTETAPLSTYLIAFAAGPWNVVTRNVALTTKGTPVPLSLWSRRSRAAEVESDTLIQMNARALRWLGDWFGVPYAFGKFDFLLAPAFPFGGMEHPGAVFYNEENFIYRERPTVSQLLGRQATTFHEVAHQWFGDYVTMRWFDDLWLKEGFATYMAAKMQAALEPTSNAWKTFYLRNKPVAYATDATAGTTPVWQTLRNLDQAKSNYGPIVYNKAPGILRQLDYLVGERAFQAGLRDFLRTHPYGNATWRDLLHSVGQASGRDLTPWGAQWILRPGMPIVEQQLVVRDGRIEQLTLTQRAAQPSISGRGAWPLKMQLLLYYDDSTAAVRLPVLLDHERTVVSAARGRNAPAFVFANDGDFGYALVLPDTASVRWLERRIGSVKDDFTRAMLWGALWDLVREARLSPVRYAALALRELPTERDEQLAGNLVGRITTALTRYAEHASADTLRARAEQVLLRGAADTTLAYGQRKAQLDAVISLAQDSVALARLDGWLDANAAAGVPLRPPTRWAIVTRLIARSSPYADARLRAEARRDSTTEGKRQAFVAEAARPTSTSKGEYFTRWFADQSLNEEWVTSSLRAFHDTERGDLTRAFLIPALDTLPWIQQNRRIFFLGSWLGATIGGQTSAEALSDIDAWLRAHPALAADLRQKVLQSRDELERTVAIRRAFGQRAM